MSTYATSVKPMTIKEFERQLMETPMSKVSVYVTPDGDIIDCRSLIGSHIYFTDMVYKSLSGLSDITDELGKKVYSSIMGIEDRKNESRMETCKIVRHTLIKNAGLDPNNPKHMELYEELYSRIADDDLLVHDMGFVKVGIIVKIGSLALCVPASSFNGHKPTTAQQRTVVELAECFNFEEDDTNNMFRSACRDSENMDRQILAVVSDNIM